MIASLILADISGLKFDLKQEFLLNFAFRLKSANKVIKLADFNLVEKGLLLTF